MARCLPKEKRVGSLVMANVNEPLSRVNFEAAVKTGRIPISRYRAWFFHTNRLRSVKKQLFFRV